MEEVESSKQQEEYSPQAYPSQQEFSLDLNTRMRDLENKISLIKDRMILVGKTLIELREKNFNEIQSMKKVLLQLKEDQTRLKEFTQRMSEKLDLTVRKEELMILQRQLDMLR